MPKFLLPIAAILACAPLVTASAQGAPAHPLPELNLQQSSALRCSAAFAIIAKWQANGDEVALQYQPLGKRGREFFVLSSARLMDEAGLDRDAVAGLFQREAQKLLAEGNIAKIMPPCLIMLEASGL